MENSNKRPILYKGELYGRSIKKGGGFGEKEMKVTFEEARENLLHNIQSTREVIQHMPLKSRLPNEIILSLTLRPEFTAKSYYPASLFDTGTEKFGISEIGSRLYRSQNIVDLEIEDSRLPPSKMFFLRATEESISAFEKELQKNESFQKKSFTTDIRKISSLGLMSGEDQILGVSNDWEEGRLEAVLHPFDIDRELSLKHFFELINKAGVDLDTVHDKQYSSGVSFISFRGNREVLESIRGYNPLRTVHPLQIRDLPTFNRGVDFHGGPKAPSFSKKSPIVVGVIDGGVNKTNPYIGNYVESEISVKGNPIPALLDHGTQVSGAVLYGALNNYGTQDTLPEPPVSVKSFGVLSDLSTDPDLYDAIDAMERFVPTHKEISVYNLSLGPKGPIFDDSISRFTYSCDLLSKKYSVLFCIAVGNDGEIEGYERIQSPSDSVNNLAVGAYTKKDGTLIKAPYSSIGPGREGGKMKPDIVAFGGCSQYPIHLVSNQLGMKHWSMGTSFSSPLVARAAARLIGESNNTIDALVAKTLITHSARTEGLYSHEMGHGALPDDIEEITNCREKSYTLIYSGEIEQGKYAEFPIPWDQLIKEGKVDIKYTAAVLTDVDHLSTDDYTSSTIELTFHPNKNKYLFTNEHNTLIEGKMKKTELVDVSVNPERAEQLLQNGWSQANFPQSSSPTKQFQTESDLRADLKWDSLDSRTVTKMASNINNPAFHIHALKRGSRVSTSKKVRFALILTVTAPKALNDIYETVLQEYDALVPIELNIHSEVNVRP